MSVRSDQRVNQARHMVLCLNNAIFQRDSTTYRHLYFLTFCKPKAGFAYILLNLQGQMPWFLVSYTFGVDCIRYLSDISPDSDSERDSGSMIAVLRVSV